MELKPELEPETWVPIPHPYFVEQATCTKNIMVFGFNGPNQSGAGAKNFLVLEPEVEPKILDPWSWSQTRNLKLEHRLHSPAYDSGSVKNLKKET